MWVLLLADYMRVGLTEVKSLIQEHIANKWQDWDSDPVSSSESERNNRKEKLWWEIHGESGDSLGNT